MFTNFTIYQNYTLVLMGKKQYPEGVINGVNMCVWMCLHVYMLFVLNTLKWQYMYFMNASISKNILNKACVNMFCWVFWIKMLNSSNDKYGRAYINSKITNQ